MNTAAVAYSDTIDRARYHIFTKKELEEHYRDSFRAVIEEYVKVRQYSPVVSSTFDPDGLDHSHKLTYASIDWLIDVERATEVALKDKPDLQKTWFAIAFEQPVDKGLEIETANRCGRFYVSRKLEPWRYHLKNRYPQKRAIR